MNKIPSGMLGILCHMDDILIFSSTQEEHDDKLYQVLQKLQACGVTLNKQNCEYSKKGLSFLGHTVDENDISPDPQKTDAILKMGEPKTPLSLDNFCGW